VQGRTIRCAE